MIKKIIKWLGNILVLLSIIFIIKTMSNFHIDYSILIQPKMLCFIIILSVISAISIFFDSMAGKFMIKDILGVVIPFKVIYKIYSKSNIGKYLPGNVMHYVSRGIYCKEHNIDSKDMYYVTILEILLKVMTAFLITIFFMYKKISSIFKLSNINIEIKFYYIIAISCILMCILYVFIYYKKRDVKESLILEVKALKPMILYSLTFFLNAALFLIVVDLLDSSLLNSEDILYVIGIYTMVWLIGYVTPGAPGGIGIKETLLLVSLSPMYGEKIVLLVAVIVRVINVFGDLIAYGVNILPNKQ
ncbi:MAG TPA: hypothetical protein DG753_06940 [Clostridium sp.]|nr:hypothetical protein [Clostridium sp.]